MPEVNPAYFLCYEAAAAELPYDPLQVLPGIKVQQITDFRHFCKALLQQPSPTVRWVLWLDAQGLGIREVAASPPGPVRVDLLDTRMQWRLHHGGVRSELLARACGLHRQTQDRPVSICDATTGWATDAALLAWHGAEVWLCERSPLMRLLLADGFRRASQHDSWKTWGERLHWVGQEACAWLNAQPEKNVDIVYLDPMFPERQKKARVKKEMIVLQHMLADEFMPANESELLQAAFRAAAKKIVVKRPKSAPFLTNLPPDQQIEGQSARFDIYLPSLQRINC